MKEIDITKNSKTLFKYLVISVVFLIGAVWIAYKDIFYNRIGITLDSGKFVVLYEEYIPFIWPTSFFRISLISFFSVLFVFLFLIFIIKLLLGKKVVITISNKGIMDHGNGFLPWSEIVSAGRLYIKRHGNHVIYFKVRHPINHFGLYRSFFGTRKYIVIDSSYMNADLILTAYKQNEQRKISNSAH